MAKQIQMNGAMASFTTTYRDFPITDAWGYDNYWQPEEYKAWFKSLEDKWGTAHARWKFQKTWEANDLSSSGSSFNNYNDFNSWAASKGLKLSLGSAVTTASNAWNFVTDLPNKLITYGGIGLAAYGGVKYAANRRDNQKAKDALSTDSGVPFLLLGGALIGYKVYTSGMNFFSSKPPENGDPKGQTRRGKLDFAKTKPMFDYGIQRLAQGNLPTLIKDLWAKYKTLYPDDYRAYLTSDGKQFYQGSFVTDMYDIWACWNTGTLTSTQNAAVFINSGFLLW